MEQLYNGTTSSSLTHIQLKSSKMGKMGEKNIWRNYGWIIYILDNTLKPQTKSLTNVKHEEPWKKNHAKGHQTKPLSGTKVPAPAESEVKSQHYLANHMRDPFKSRSCSPHGSHPRQYHTEQVWATLTKPCPTCTFMSWAKDTIVLGH